VAVINRQTSSRGADLSWRESSPGAGAARCGGLEEAQSRRGSDAVHDVVGCVPTAFVALQRTSGSGSWDTGREPDACRTGRIDRFLCEHARAAREGRRRLDFSQAAGTGKGSVCWRVCASGGAFRESSGGVTAATQPESYSVVSSLVHGPERSGEI